MATAVIINLGIADLDMKEGYPPMFIAYYTGDRLRHHHLRTLYVSGSLLCHDRVFFETWEVFC